MNYLQSKFSFWSVFICIDANDKNDWMLTSMGKERESAYGNSFM